MPLTFSQNPLYYYYKYGDATVSTGILKSGIAIGGGRLLKSPKLLKINDESNVALAA